MASVILSGQKKDVAELDKWELGDVEHAITDKLGEDHPAVRAAYATGVHKVSFRGWISAVCAAIETASGVCFEA